MGGGGGVIFARETIFQGDGVPIESKVRLSAGASPFYRKIFSPPSVDGIWLWVL